MIVRGTTLTHGIKIPVKGSDISVMFVTYKQINGTVLEKSLADITFDDTNKMAKIFLSQNDTLSFKPYTTLNSDIVEVQCRAVTNKGESYVTEPLKLRVKDVYKEGVLGASNPNPKPDPDVPGEDGDDEIIYDGGGVNG